MEYSFVFRHIHNSPALKTYTQKKLDEKIRKYVTKPVGAHITFSEEAGLHHAQCHVYAGDGFSRSAHVAGTDLYRAVNGMITRLGRQLRRQKEKIKKHA